jgi:hypothetical protein
MKSKKQAVVFLNTAYERPMCLPEDTDVPVVESFILSFY